MTTRRRITLPHDLDPLIRSLVEAINAFGLETIGSCQGHLPGTERTISSSRFPLVLFRPGKDTGLVHRLNYVITGGGGFLNLPKLHERWIISVCSSSPELNPQNYPYFALEPECAIQTRGEQRPYPARLELAQQDLLTLTRLIMESPYGARPSRAPRRRP